MLARIFKQQKLLSATVCLFTLSVGVLIGTLATTGVQAAKGQAVAPDATPLVIPAAASNETDFTRLAKMAEPSVVNITTDFTAPKSAMSKRPRSAQPDEEEDENSDLFRRFFRDMPGGQGGGGMGGARPRAREATGTGFIVDKNGYILTNNHIPYTAKAMPRLSMEKVSLSMACSLGCRPPPPAPCKMRNTTSIPRLDANPQRKELTAKTATQPM